MPRKPKSLPTAAALASSTISAPLTVGVDETFAVSGNCDPTYPAWFRFVDNEYHAYVTGGMPANNGDVGPVYWVDYTPGVITITLLSDVGYGTGVFVPVEVATTNVTVA